MEVNLAEDVFGTDGVRGKVGTFPITPDFMVKLGWAFGEFIRTENPTSQPKTVVIGKDTRLSGYMLETALQAGLVAAGVNCKLVGVLPTPGIAYLTNLENIDAGLMISASHNPFYDNGVKFFLKNANKVSDEKQIEIKKFLASNIKIKECHELGRLQRDNRLVDSYLDFLISSSNSNNASFKDLNLIIDCANGANSRHAEKVFKNFAGRIKLINSSPDGININENCGATNLKSIIAEVKSANVPSIGISFDGDGDRLLMIAEDGSVVTGDDIIYILTKHFIASGIVDNTKGVVGTVMTNLGLELWLRSKNIPFLRTKVGDKYVQEAIKTNGWLLGGELSGHIICNQELPTGDGMLAAIQVLSYIAEQKLSLKEAVSGFEKTPQFLANVNVINKKSILSNSQLQEFCQMVETKLGTEGRIILRPSGTENLLRVMVEGVDNQKINVLGEDLVNKIIEINNNEQQRNISKSIR